MVGGYLGLSGDCEATIMNVDIDVFLLQAWKLKASCHDILLTTLVQVHSIGKIVSALDLDPE